MRVQKIHQNLRKKKGKKQKKISRGSLRKERMKKKIENQLTSKKLKGICIVLLDLFI